MAQKLFTNFLFHERTSCVEEIPSQDRKPMENPKSLRVYSLARLEHLFGVESDFLATSIHPEILFFRKDDAFLREES